MSMKVDYKKAANKFPNTAYHEYHNHLVAYVDETEDRFRNIWESGLTAHVQLLADDDQDRVERDLDRIEETFMGAITALALKRKIENMGSQVRQNAIVGLKKELQHILGEPYTFPIRPRPIDNLIQQTIKENVSLVQSIARDQHKELERLIYKGARVGWSKDRLEKEIFHVFDVSRGRANVIALDQTGSLNSAINKNIQHSQLGLGLFSWISMADEKVRPKHRSIASNEFGEECYEWENPPMGILPGISEPNCRCWASPCPKEVKREFGGQVNVFI